MKNKVTLLLSILVFCSYQAFCGKHVQIRFKNNERIASSTTNGKTVSLQFSDPGLNQIFSKLTVTSYKKAYPSAAKLKGAIFDTLLRVYDIDIDGTPEEVVSAIRELKSPDLDNAYVTQDPILMWEPNDYYDCYSRCLTGDIYWASASNHLDLINAQKAWDYTRGLGSVKVGVVDETIGFHHHFDLNNKTTLGPGAVWQAPGTYVSAHGTSVAGLIGAETDNPLTSYGSADAASIGNKVNITYYNWFYNGILDAIADGCKVINCSWGGAGFPDPNEQLIIDGAYNSGVTVVAAAGNGAGGNATIYYYPASYDHVISVTSVGSRWPIGSNNGTACGYSNWNDCHIRFFNPACSQYNTTHQHNDKVDICAPGMNVETTIWDNVYANVGGTSMSSPIVAGTAALLYSLNPNFTPDQIGYYIKQSAANIYTIPQNSPFTGLLGAGRVDAGSAMALASADGCQPMFSDIIWTAGGSAINNWDCWNYSSVTFSTSTLPLRRSTTTWEFRYKDHATNRWISFTRNGNTPTVTFGLAGSGADVIYYTSPRTLPMCINTLEVYVRQEDDVLNPVCVSAYYKETSYNEVCQYTKSGSDVPLTVANNKLSANDDDYLKVYPSPAYTNITINLNDKNLQSGKATYTVLNSAGKVVLSGKVSNGSSNINISSLPKGLYIVTVNNKISENKKLIKL